MPPEEAARLGAEVLDHVKVGWADEVDLDRFDMHQLGPECHDECGCVLYHVFGSFPGGMLELNKHPNTENTISLGAFSGWSSYHLLEGDRETENWTRLTDAWRGEVEVRKSA